MSQAVYFLSDFHLPVYQTEEGIAREKKIISFLHNIAPTATDIFLLGDIFDFWFEFQHAVPKGYTRLLGTLAQLADSGIHIHYFVGNHDMWLRDYFQKELGVTVYFKPQKMIIEGKNFLIGHGDGIGPKQWKYKFLKRFFFKNKFLYPFFIRLFHPDWLMPIGNLWSTKSRQYNSIKEKTYLGDDKEFLVQFCKQYLQKESIDYFIFGHRHLPLEIRLNEKSFYYNTGDMIRFNSYLVYQNHILQLQYAQP